MHSKNNQSLIAKLTYHYIKNKEWHIHKTTFSNPYGLFEWVIMPFGLKRSLS